MNATSRTTVGRIRERCIAAGAAARSTMSCINPASLDFEIKVVAREYRRDDPSARCPELKQAALRQLDRSEPQLQPVTRWTAAVRQRAALPNLTHVVRRIRSCSTTGRTTGGILRQLRTSLACYRGKVKVYETPVVERTKIDAPDRRAALFQFEVPPEAFTPGLYTCQINIIDAVAGKFAFPRLALYVR
jgi:hypothetical protein